MLQTARALDENDEVLAALRLRLVLLGSPPSPRPVRWAGCSPAGSSGPIERLRDTAERIARTQDLDEPVPTGGGGEIGSLAGSFSTMVDALAASRVQQQQLITDASHELRTPLTSLRTNAELLDRGDQLDAEQRRAAAQGIRLEVDELTNLVSELVELATDRSSDEEAPQPAALVELARRRGRPRHAAHADRTVDVIEHAAEPVFVGRAHGGAGGHEPRRQRGEVQRRPDRDRGRRRVGSRSATAAPASRSRTSRTCSTASTARTPHAASRARASGSRSCSRSSSGTTAGSGRATGRAAARRSASSCRPRPRLDRPVKSGPRLPAMRFGIFMAPFHPVGQNPTLALERDLELIQHLDALGFDEAWVGEHHSAGYEIIASPEVFIGVAAERTKHIKLGTGVSSLPYHHPLMLADRMVLLDHLTRGRTMLGVGPGQLTSDAHMLGIPADAQRPRMEESLDAMMALLRGETVSMETDGFVLRDARLQLAPYSDPCFDIAVAASFSPTGRAGGRQARHRHALGRGDRPPGDGPAVAPLEHVGGARARERPRRRPREVAPRRPDVPRRDARAGRGATSSTASRSSPATSRTSSRPAPCRATLPARSSRTTSSRASRSSARPTTRSRRSRSSSRRAAVRRVPLLRERLGDPGQHQAQLRAVRPVRDAAVPGPARTARRVVRLGHRLRRRVRRARPPTRSARPSRTTPPSSAAKQQPAPS